MCWVMSYSMPKPMICCVIAAALVTGCSPPQGARDQTLPERSTKTFSETDKLAARVLSIGNTGQLPAVNDTYVEALMCHNAAVILRDYFRKSGMTDPQQVAALAAATEFFDRHVQDLMTEKGRSDAQLAEDRRQTAAKYPDAAANAQIFMACVTKQKNAV